MQAIQGYYENGTVRLDRQAPIRRGKIIVLFPDDELNKKPRMSDDEAMRLFSKFTGSIERKLDIEMERDEYFNEKFGPFD